MPNIVRAPKNTAPLKTILKLFPKSGRLIQELRKELFKGSSMLTSAECELIAAYVSELNSSLSCLKAHSANAEVNGIGKNQLESVLEDIESAECEEKLKSILHFVKKLTLTPSRMTPDDAETIFDSGWDKETYYYIVSICSITNYTNRMVSGYYFYDDNTK